jgi:hypothetical protein
MADLRALYWESMTLVAKLRGRQQRRSRLVAAVAVGMLLAILTLYKVTLLPPNLHARALNVAAASTTLMVDTKHAASTDLGIRTDAMEGLSVQANLVGEVMVTDPVLDEIGRIAGINPLDIQATAPVTSDVPRTEIEPDSGANATALIQAPDRYKLQVQVDPTMPILHIYTQAPTADEAERLASASVTGLRAYLGKLSTSQTVSLSDEIQLIQLGAVHGGVVNHSAAKELALLAFITGFAATLFGFRLAARFRSGWHLAGLSAQTDR